MDKHSDDIHVSELDIIMYRYIGLINILNNYKYNYIDKYTQKTFIILFELHFKYANALWNCIAHKLLSIDYTVDMIRSISKLSIDDQYKWLIDHLPIYRKGILGYVLFD